ncbi:hypothetical protein NS283_11750 [Microbacterium testaceum]|nr:hypothetical protein NS283_11750 [Microbacterium testaceum]
MLASLVASFIFLGWTRLLTPKIVISPHISVYPSNDAGVGDRYRVKIKNDRYRSVSDISVSVFVQERRVVTGGEIKVNKRIGTVWSTHTVVRKRRNDPEKDNCRRVRILSDELEEVYLSKDHPHVLVEVYCRDSWSGVGRVFRQSYAGIDGFRYGSFKHGDSMEIDPYVGHRKMVLLEKLKQRDEALAAVAQPADIQQSAADATASEDGTQASAAGRA